MLVSKAVRKFFDERDPELLEMILHMNEKYNLYNGKNFTWAYDEDTESFYCVNADGEEYATGITCEKVYPEIYIDFIVMEDESYVCVYNEEVEF